MVRDSVQSHITSEFTKGPKMKGIVDYLNPRIPAGLKTIAMPVVRATEATLAGYGSIVGVDYKNFPVEMVKPSDFVCFWFDGSQGLYIHPNIWHEGVFTVGGVQRFFDKQGAVHARVSVNFATEFDCLVEAALTPMPI